MAVALFVLKPRVPGRPLEQSVEEFWSTPETGAKVFPIWFLLEGAGVIAAVGCLLTSGPVSVIAMGLSIATYWLCGPNGFAKV